MGIRAIITAIVVLAGANVSAVSFPWLSGGVSRHNETVKDIKPPRGFERIAVDSAGYGAWLRSLPLKPEGTVLRTYDGRSWPDQRYYERILDIDVGDRNLQQCADAAIRLRAEYLYSRRLYDSISFRFTNGDRAEFSKWSRGYRPRVSGNRSQWRRSGAADSSYASLRSYLNTVFTYAGTYSLQRDMKPVARDDSIRPGDVFVRGGFPGHAIIVLDVARDERGRLALLLAQSFMPAQDIHILKNYWYRKTSPWYIMKPGGALRTRYWSFDWSHLRRFP